MGADGSEPLLDRLLSEFDGNGGGVTECAGFIRAVTREEFDH